MILFANKYANLVKEAVHVDVDGVTVAGVVHDVLGVPVAQADDVTDLKWCEIMCKNGSDRGRTCCIRKKASSEFNDNC